ncbi:MAG: hypothetical protein ACOYMR_08295 [Ilumatobacteraceae bacterium]
MFEAIASAAGGAALGWFAGGWLHPAVGVAMAVVAGLNGAICGARHIYPWRRPQGVVAFVLDSTWACIPVLTGLGAHLIAFATNGGYVPVLSERRSYHVYRRGAVPREGYAMTLGNVVSGAGAVDQPRRAKLVADHESVHVWQARWFGPAYLLLYGLWSALAAVVAPVVWLARGRREPFGRVVHSCAYYMNPFEWWAYSRDAVWPPSSMVRGLGWRRPAVQSFAARRAASGREHT